ncbi:MAG: adenine phosphoribosyltransferase [Bacteroidota bacterium]|jgi:adenine phosphoribosyltransferase
MESSVLNRFKQTIRDVKDFPKEGIIFKDITPILSDSILSRDVLELLKNQVNGLKIDAVVGIESRGFLFGMLLSQALEVPFIPIRKKGKLPYKTLSYRYDLEYGSAEVEMHVDALQKGMSVLIHDDLLATGGTAAAAAELSIQCGANISAFSFLIDLEFLQGKKMLEKYSDKIFSLVTY